MPTIIEALDDVKTQLFYAEHSHDLNATVGNLITSVNTLEAVIEAMLVVTEGILAAHGHNLDIPIEIDKVREKVKTIKLAHRVLDI